MYHEYHPVIVCDIINLDTIFSESDKLRVQFYILVKNEHIRSFIVPEPTYSNYALFREKDHRL